MPSLASLLRPAALLCASAFVLLMLSSSGVVGSSHLAFGTPVTLGGGAEPSIQVAPGGSPYYVESANNIWRSTDKGATWTRITPTNQLLAGDANAAVGSNGNLYYQTLWLGSSWAWTSFDQGATWPVSNAFSTNLLVDRNWIAAHGTDTVYAKADMINVVQTPVIYRSDDAGVTYLPTTGVIDGALSDSGGFKGALTVDPNSGALYLPADQATNVVSSIDQADSLRVAKVPNPYGPHYDTILTVSVDGAGNAYLAWISQHANKWTVQYSYSTNQGLTWSTPHIVASGGGASRVFPWSAANGTGNLAIAWYETTTSSAGPDAVPNTTPWKVRVAQVTSAATATPGITTVDATGVVHRGKICTSGVTCASGTRNLLDFLGVAIDPTDGRALVVYADDSAGSAVVKFVKQSSGPTF